MLNSFWTCKKGDGAESILRWVLSIVVLASSVFAADQRNYMDAANAEAINSAVSHMVWRAKPAIKVYTYARQPKEVDLTRVHDQLRKLTLQDRAKLDSADYAGSVIKNLETKRNGNCACACLSIVYADGSTYNVSTSETDQENLITVVPKINQTALPKEFSLNGFTTIKAKKNANAPICVTSLPNNIRVARSLIEKTDERSYWCAEPQIVSNLFPDRGYHPFKDFIKKSVQRNKTRPISLIVLNVYSELDPCGWCGPMLVKLSEKVNGEKPWLGLIEECLRMEKTELEQQQKSYRTQIEQLKSVSEGGNLLECSDEDLKRVIAAWQKEENKRSSRFPSLTEINLERLKQAREAYKSAKSRLEQLEKDYEESKNAMFLVVVSSSQECHRSRKIGLDPVFMDKVLCDRPIVINLSGQDISKLDSYLSLPPNFVVFTPASDVQGFPFFRLSNPGLSLPKLLEDAQ